VLQVHDEVVVEARATQAAEVCAVVVDVLEHAFELRVPLRVQAGIGATWWGAKGD
jgi:DNA polymerase-1